MNRRLILLRHGQTAWNLARRYQGHTDVELDDTGLAQAAAVAPAIAELKPALLWSSDLTRASRTAQCIAELTGLEVVTDARLREYDVGALTGRTREEVQASVLGESETHDQVTTRVHAVLEDVWALLADDQTAVVVGHGGALRSGLLGFLGWPGELRDQLFGMTNCGWAEVGEDPEGGRRLAAYNRTVGG